MRFPKVFVAATALTALALGGCSTSTAELDAEAEVDGLRVAVVDNPDIEQMKDLVDHFTEDTGVNVSFDVLGEGELRQKVTTDIATGAGRYDVVMVGPYETPIWAERGWLTPLGADADSGLIPSVAGALSVDDELYALPFYGEAAFTMYRSDLFEEAGLTMPDQPTWQDLLDFAAELDDPQAGVYGACMRGEPGWGENVVLVTAMVNAFGGRWFDEDWVPQLDTEPWHEALTAYADLAKFADPDTPNMGYNENLEKFRDGGCAIWMDSTAAAAHVTEEGSAVEGDVAFAPAPTAGGKISSNWLWTWALAVPTATKNEADAKAFVEWATSPEYEALVAETHGWLSVPPGTRTELYENPEYLEAAPFATLVYEALLAADPLSPTEEPVPYTGIQYVMIPEFQGIGTAVGNQIAEVIRGEISVDEALENSQWVTETVSERIRFTEEEE